MIFLNIINFYFTCSSKIKSKFEEIIHETPESTLNNILLNKKFNINDSFLFCDIYDNILTKLQKEVVNLIKFYYLKLGDDVLKGITSLHSNQKKSFSYVLIRLLVEIEKLWDKYESHVEDKINIINAFSDFNIYKNSIKERMHTILVVEKGEECKIINEEKEKKGFYVEEEDKLDDIEENMMNIKKEEEFIVEEDVNFIEEKEENELIGENDFRFIKEKEDVLTEGQKNILNIEEKYKISDDEDLKLIEEKENVLTEDQISDSYIEEKGKIFVNEDLKLIEEKENVLTEGQISDSNTEEKGKIFVEDEIDLLMIKNTSELKDFKVEMLEDDKNYSSENKIALIIGRLELKNVLDNAKFIIHNVLYKYKNFLFEYIDRNHVNLKCSVEYNLFKKYLDSCKITRTIIDDTEISIKKGVNEIFERCKNEIYMYLLN